MMGVLFKRKSVSVVIKIVSGSARHMVPALFHNDILHRKKIKSNLTPAATIIKRAVENGVKVSVCFNFQDYYLIREIKT